MSCGEGIIAVAIIDKARKLRRCATCNLIIRGRTVRLFGRAYRGDPPRASYICWSCAEGSNETELLFHPEIHPPRKAPHVSMVS